MQKSLYDKTAHNLKFNGRRGELNRTVVPKSTNAFREKGMPGNPESHYDFYLENKKGKRKSEK